jgi:hypothetical protein
MNLKEKYLAYIWNHKEQLAPTLNFREWLEEIVGIRSVRLEDEVGRLWLNQDSYTS